MPSYRNILKTLGAIFLLLILVTPCFGTWKQIANFNSPIGCCFFLDADHGFVGSGTYSLNFPLQIWFTTDGGTTWTNSGVPVGTGEVTQINIAANGVGFASIFSQGNPRMNLWKTTDGGFSWQDISTGTFFGSGIGAGWPVTGGGTNGVFTMNGGNTITTLGPNSGREAWSAYGDSARNIWYIVTELSRRLDISTDGGTTWKYRYNFGVFMTGGHIPTGEIIGLGDQLYIQTEADGIFRGNMHDTGASWHSLGGPSNYADTRTIYVAGCQGQNLYAFDAGGGLWFSNDGGDGSTLPTYRMKIQHIDFNSIPSCQNTTKKAWITNLGCPPYVITNVTLLNNAAGVYSLLQSVKLPDTLASGDTAFFIVKFDPKLKPGGYNSLIRLQGYYEATEGVAAIEADSNINIAGAATPVAPESQTNLQTIDFGNVSLCGNGVDSIFTIRNIGCDTFRVIAQPPLPPLPGSLDSAFTIDDIILPYILPPDSTIIIHVHFKPLHAGAVSSFSIFTVSSEGTSGDIKFFMQGNGISGEGTLNYPFTEIDFDTISFCSNDSVATFITNTGCGPLIVNTYTDNQVAFWLSGDGVKPGTVIQPGDTLHYTIHLGDYYNRLHLFKGLDTAHFFIEFANGIPRKNLYIFIKGFVAEGRHVLSAIPNTIDFGQSSLCDAGKDTVITLHNPGCDTLVISKGQVFSKGYILNGISFPIIIPPDSSSKITIGTLLDTTGGKFTSIDSLMFSSNSDSANAPIKLTHTFIPHREVGMYLDASAQRGTDLGVIYYNIKETPGKSFTGAGVKRIDFDLVRNTDLLEFISSKSSSSLTGTPNGTSFSLTNAAEITADANSILATAAFRVYLTKDSNTDITLANVKMNGLDSSGGPCLLTFSTGGVAHFNYDFVCGEQSISGFMNDIMPMKIISIRPNPAQDEITIDLFAPFKQQASVEIINSLGEKIYSGIQSLNSGPNTIHSDMRNHAGGIYLIRINSEQGITSQSFLKLK